jgi:hypothetical protein
MTPLPSIPPVGRPEGTIPLTDDTLIVHDPMTPHRVYPTKRRRDELTASPPEYGQEKVGDAPTFYTAKRRPVLALPSTEMDPNSPFAAVTAFI